MSLRFARVHLVECLEEDGLPRWKAVFPDYDDLRVSSDSLISCQHCALDAVRKYLKDDQILLDAETFPLQPMDWA